MSQPLLVARNLSKTYRNRGLGGTGAPVHAVRNVSLEIGRGSVLALAGQSGSGKSTVARLLLALEPPDTGTVLFDGIGLHEVSSARLRRLRRRFQAVFQDPYASLNPRLTIRTIVAEPLRAAGNLSSGVLTQRVGELLELAGLPARFMAKRPGSLSGGERQRVAIARALATRPDLLILDEPLSALDVSIQAQILNLLLHLREELGLAMLFISHDLALVRLIAGKTAVMYEGAVVEQGPTATLLTAPMHPYTQTLLGESTPAQTGRAGQPASSAPWPEGSCPFAPSCPFAAAACTKEPPLEELAPDHLVACWFPPGVKAARAGATRS